jgi:hypothetical protein
LSKFVGNTRLNTALDARHKLRSPQPALDLVGWK